MTGRSWIDDAERPRLAREAARGRANKIPWKVLERVYGRSRWQLKRYIAALKAENAPKKPRNAPSPRLSGHAPP